MSELEALDQLHDAIEDLAMCNYDDHRVAALKAFGKVSDLFKQQQENMALMWTISERSLSEFVEYTTPCPGGKLHTTHCRDKIAAFLKMHLKEHGHE